MSDPSQLPLKINSQPMKPSADSSSIIPPSPTGIINYLREENKATIASCSSELHNCPATNLLNSHRNRIWMSEEGLPQSVTIDMSHLADRPRSFKCVGWDCWHDYITNPQTVEISVSQDGKIFITWITLRTELKQGVQLFDIDAISRMYNFIKFTILTSHGGSKVYMNAVYLLEDNPESNHINLNISPKGSPSQSQLELQPSHRIPYYQVPQQPQEFPEQQQLQLQQQQYQIEEQSWEQQEQDQYLLEQQQLQTANRQQHLHNNHLNGNVAGIKQFYGQSQQQPLKAERYNQHPHHEEQQQQQQQQQSQQQKQQYSARQSQSSSSQQPQGHPQQYPQHQYVNSAVNDLRLNGVHSVTSYQGDRAKSSGNGSVFYSPQMPHSPINNIPTNPSSFVVDPFIQGYIPQQQQQQQDINGRKELVIDGNQSGFSGFEGGDAAAPSGLRELMPEFDGKSSTVSSSNNNNNSNHQQDAVSHWHSPNTKYSSVSINNNTHNPQSRGEFSKQLMAQQGNQLIVEQNHIQNIDQNIHRNNNFEQFKHSYHSNNSHRIQEPYQQDGHNSNYKDRDHSRKDSNNSNHLQHPRNNNIDMRLFDQGVISYREGDQQYYQHEISENIPENNNDQQHSRINTLNNSSSKQQYRQANLSPYSQQQQQPYCNLDNDSSNAVSAGCIAELKQEVKQLRDQLYSTQQSVAVLGEVAYKLQDTKNVIIEKLSLIQESLLCFKQEIYERISVLEERDTNRDQQNQEDNSNKQMIPDNLKGNDKCQDVDNNVLDSYLPQKTQNKEGHEDAHNSNTKRIETDKVDSEILLKAVKDMIDKRVGTLENGLSNTLAGLINTSGQQQQQQQQQLFTSAVIYFEGKLDNLNSSNKSKRIRDIITSHSPRESDDDNAPFTPQSQRLHDASQSSHSNNNNNNSIQEREIAKVSSQKEPIAILLKQLQEKLALRQTKVEELNSQKKQHLKRKGGAQQQQNQVKQQMDKQETTSKRYA